MALTVQQHNKHVLLYYTTMSFLTILSADILTSFIFSYLEVKDLSNLEIAISKNPNYRAALEDCFRSFAVDLHQHEKSKNYIHLKNHRFDNNDFIPLRLHNLNWLVSKGIIVKEIRYSEEEKRELNYALFLKLVLQCSSSLQYVNFSECLWITDLELIIVAETCQQLKYVNVGSCDKITDKSMSRLSKKCSSICHVDFRCQNITNSALIDFAQNCPDLLSINLSSCRKVTETGLVILVEYCRKITHINLTNCRVTESVYVMIGKNCPNLKSFHFESGLMINLYTSLLMTGLYRLEHINIQKNKLVTDRSILYIARNCPRLRVIQLSYLNLTDNALHSLAENCYTLEDVSLRECEVTGDGVLHLLEQCTVIHSLDIGLNTTFTFDFYSKLFTRSSRLISLNLFGCPISDVDLKLLTVTHCPLLHQLQYLGLLNCHNLSSVGIRCLVQGGTSCRYIDAKSVVNDQIIDEVILENVTNGICAVESKEEPEGGRSDSERKEKIDI